jgi:hypothetical protein
MLLGPGATDPKSDVTALEKPISVLSKPVSAIKGDPRVTRTVPPPVPNNMPGVQAALDRALGYIPDNQVYELDRLDLLRDERLGRVEPMREADRLALERDRQLRLEDRARMNAQELERARREELDRREYLISLYSGSSALAGQVEADRIALENAKAERDRALVEASNSLDRGLAQRGADRAELKARYEQQVTAIQNQYKQTRARILGAD